MRPNQSHTFLLFFLLPVIHSSTNPSHLSAQTPSIIQGRVINKSTGEPLAGAHITFIGTRWGATTDASGRYHLEHLPPGNYAVQASMIGFANETLPNVILEAGKIHNMDFVLIPKPVALDTVRVEAERLWEKYQAEVSKIGVQRMQAEEITDLPGAFDDPARAIQVRHGSAGAGDFNSFLTVRGSSPEQNLVVMDGAVIPNPYRFRLALGGGLSIFDSKTTQDVHLHLGGFTAEYGNTLSSVLEVDTRTGNSEHFKFGGAINLTDAGGIIEGPLLRKKGSFLFAARRSYLDLLAKRLTRSNSVYPHFYDVTNKWLFSLNERNKITLAFTASRERADLLSDLSAAVSITEQAKTHHGILSWKSLLSSRGQLQTLFSYYDDAMTLRVFNPNGDATASDYQNLAARAGRLSIKQSIRYRLTGQSWLTAGVSGDRIHSKINFHALEQNFYFARNEFPEKVEFDDTHHYYAVFVENTAELSRKLQTRIGLRYDYATLVGGGELSPRFGLWYAFDEQTTIEGSWGVFFQYPDPYTIIIRDQPLDIGANRDIIAAEKATHNVVGVKRKLNEEITASLEFYNMDIDRLLLPEDRMAFKPVNEGRGISRGIELVLEKKSPGASASHGLISYSFGSSRYLHSRNNQWVPFNYDRRHGLTLWYKQRIRGKWQLSLLWRYAGGLPYTEVVGVRISQHAAFEKFDWDFIRGTRNAKRFPSYHRLDARLSYSVHAGNRSFSFYLDAINLYNRQNLYNLTWEREPVQETGPTLQAAKRRTLYMLPFLPSLGIQFRI